MAFPAATERGPPSKRLFTNSSNFKYSQPYIIPPFPLTSVLSRKGRGGGTEGLYIQWRRGEMEGIVIRWGGFTSPGGAGRERGVRGSKLLDSRPTEYSEVY